MRDIDDYLMLITLVFIGVIGMAIPIICALFGFWIGVLFAIFIFWFMPGFPIPILHDFLHGWQPFISAYFIGLSMFFEEGCSDEDITRIQKIMEDKGFHYDEVRP